MKKISAVRHHWHRSVGRRRAARMRFGKIVAARLPIPAPPSRQPRRAANTPAPNQTPNDTAGLTRPNVKVSSPVIIEEYGDYQCPPCGQLYPELKQIETEYGDQVKIVFRHFPLMKMHKNALLAAHAAEAARNQNKFWEMHDRLYRNQKEWSELADPRPVFEWLCSSIEPEARPVQ